MVRRSNPVRGRLAAMATAIRNGFLGLSTRLGQRLYATPPGASAALTTAVPITGPWIDLTLAPLADFALLVKGTGGAPTDWDVYLEGSLDGVNAEVLLQHSAFGGQADGETVFSTAPTPVSWVRFRVDALTLGPASDIVVTGLGMPR